MEVSPSQLKVFGDCSRQVDVAWAAGIIEGEGTLVRARTAWHLAVVMRDADVVERVAGVFPGGRLTWRRPNGHGKHVLRQWRLTARDAVYAAVLEIYPYMGERRQRRCDQFLKWYEAQPPVREAMARGPKEAGRRRHQKMVDEMEGLAEKLGRPPSVAEVRDAFDLTYNGAWYRVHTYKGESWK